MLCHCHQPTCFSYILYITTNNDKSYIVMAVISIVHSTQYIYTNVQEERKIDKNKTKQQLLEDNAL